MNKPLPLTTFEHKTYKRRKRRSTNRCSESSSRAVDNRIIKWITVIKNDWSETTTQNFSQMLRDYTNQHVTLINVRTEMAYWSRLPDSTTTEIFTCGDIGHLLCNCRYNRNENKDQPRHSRESSNYRRDNFRFRDYHDGSPRKDWNRDENRYDRYRYERSDYRNSEHHDRYRYKNSARYKEDATKTQSCVPALTTIDAENVSIPVSAIITVVILVLTHYQIPIAWILLRRLRSS